MSEKSEIDWTDASWPVVTGCTRISTGCENCWAIRHSNRLSKNPNLKISSAYEGTIARRNGRLEWSGTVRCLPERLDWPVKWKKPRRIFVSPMADLFHEQVPDVFISSVMAAIMLAPQHTYQILTKRPNRMRDYFMRRVPHYGDPIKKLWLGISAEDQPTFNKRLLELLHTPAAVRFVSLEPLLGPINFRDGPLDPDNSTMGEWSQLDFLDWVIVGGESGPGARPMHPDWVRSIRDQCQEVGMPFFFKQWGEWLRHVELFADDDKCHLVNKPRHGIYARVGKRAAGRELDGRIWEEMPK